MNSSQFRRNAWTFSLGTVGRDAVFALVTLYFIVYLTEVIDLPNWALAVVSTLILVARLFDAVMGIVLGSVMDNIRARWGRYEPWIVVGVVASGGFTILLFSDFGLTGGAFVAAFAVVFLLWTLSWSANDIPYWSLWPSLTFDQARREKLGSAVKTAGTVGIAAVVVSIIPVTTAVGERVGAPRAWLWFAIVAVVVMVLGQCITVLGTKVPNLVADQPELSLRQVVGVITKNDQLVWMSVAMVIFTTGYMATAIFGVYYFRYLVGNEAAYAPFLAVVGVANIAGYLAMPALRRRFTSRTLHIAGSLAVTVGYVVMFLAPTNLVVAGLGCSVLSAGLACVVVLMLEFVTDTIDYGHWKLGQRHSATTFALQPLIHKVGAALGTQIVAITLILTGINQAATPSAVTAQGLLGLRLATLVLPAVLTLISLVVMLRKYSIDEQFHAQILGDLRARRQLVDEMDESRR